MWEIRGSKQAFLPCSRMTRDAPAGARMGVEFDPAAKATKGIKRGESNTMLPFLKRVLENNSTITKLNISSKAARCNKSCCYFYAYVRVRLLTRFAIQAMILDQRVYLSYRLRWKPTPPSPSWTFQVKLLVMRPAAYARVRLLTCIDDQEISSGLREHVSYSVQ